LDNGNERIDSAAELARVRRQVRKVYAESLSLAAVLTALLLLIPGR
jgi:hypothetical protein